MKSIALLAFVALGGATFAQSEAQQLAALRTRIEANANKITQLQAQIAAEKQADMVLTLGTNQTLTATYTRDNQLTNIGKDLAVHENKTKYMTVSGDNVYITGANVQIWSGSQTANGKGNLILGFNNPRTGAGVGNYRTGSHNLIVGDGINYTSQYGIAGGYLNNLYSMNGVVLTGEVNTVTGSPTSQLILTGYRNTVSESQAVIVTGNDNKMQSARSVILTGSFGTVVGGYESVLLNGEKNKIQDSIRGVMLTGNESLLKNANYSVLSTGNKKTLASANTIN